MNVGARIRELRKKAQLSGVELAARAGLNQSYLSKLERGRAGYSAEGIEALANALGVGLADVFGSSGMTPVPVGGRLIPILDFIPAGLPGGVAQTFRNDDVSGYIACDLRDPDELFGMIIKGRSMEPEFREGDTIIVRYGLMPHPGNYVVATDTELRESTFKKYKEIGTDANGRTVFALVPLNDDYPTLRSDERPLKIVGTMVRHTRDYRR